MKCLTPVARVTLFPPLTDFVHSRMILSIDPQARNRDESAQSGIPSQVPTRPSRPKLRGRRPRKLWCQLQHDFPHSPTHRLVQPGVQHEQRRVNAARKLSLAGWHEYQLRQPTTKPKVTSHVAGVVSSKEFSMTTPSFAPKNICYSVRLAVWNLLSRVTIAVTPSVSGCWVETATGGTTDVTRSQPFDCPRTFRMLL